MKQEVFGPADHHVPWPEPHQGMSSPASAAAADIAVAGHTGPVSKPDPYTGLIVDSRPSVAEQIQRARPAPSLATHQTGWPCPITTPGRAEIGKVVMMDHGDE